MAYIESADQRFRFNLRDLPPAAREYATSAYDNLVKDVREHAGVVPDPARRLDGFIRIQIRNNGTKTAKDVKLTVPRADLLSVTSPTSRVIPGAVFALPQLAALDSVEVIAFVYSRPTYKEADAITLVHDEGVATLKITAPDRPVSLVWFLIPALGALLIAIANIFRPTRPTSNAEES